MATDRGSGLTPLFLHALLQREVGRRMAMVSERDAAMRQLDAALDEQVRLSEDWRAEIGTPNEIGAYARLQVTSEEIDALRGWLAQSDEDRGGGRVWLNGHEVGGRGRRYPGLEDSHD